MIRRIKRLQKRLNLGRPVQSVELQLVHTQVMGKPVTFCVNMENDPIQRNHRRGGFYEQKELNALRAVFPQGGTFVDIGANVGNHSLFAALFLGAGRVIPFEPNPRAFELLVQNVIVNGLRDVIDISKIGVGLSDSHSGGFAMQKRERNLGGAKMLEGEGDLEVFRADELLADETPDFIKIDVEGMEMKVLSGLRDTLERGRPTMMVEVDNTAEDEFRDWVRTNGFGFVATHARYRLNKNHVIADADRVEALQAALDGTALGTGTGQAA